MRAATTRSAAPAGRADQETRARLLAAAERLFADRGFKKVSVREICRAASANVAAVNYHFRDKIGLYREVWQAAIDRLRATTEAARQACAGQAADEQLRRYIMVVVRNALASDRDPMHRLFMHELHDPTPALDALVEQAVRPRMEDLSRIVAAIIGCPPSDTRVLRCLASVQAQTVAYLRLHNPIAQRLGFSTDPKTPREIDEIAEHIAAFSLAGVRGITNGRS